MALPPTSSSMTGAAAAAPAPSRFLPSEVAEKEACKQKLPAGGDAVVPCFPAVHTLAAKFSAKAELAGKQLVVQARQVGKWFKNRGAHHAAGSSSAFVPRDSLTCSTMAPLPASSSTAASASITATATATATAAAAAPPAPPQQFFFLPSEVAQMEACLLSLPVGVLVPSLLMMQHLAVYFSARPERASKQVVVHPRQVWMWFHNNLSRAVHHGSFFFSSFSFPAPALQYSVEGPELEFEGKSAHDGSWYDVVAFLSERRLESGDLEVQVRFAGFQGGGDEWINVRKCLRQCSLTCADNECFTVLPGDLILCFQETCALYFDAHILSVQRRRHDGRGCHCRFLVRYDHDSSEEIVPLTKVYRRPETDYRLQILQAAPTCSYSHST